MSQLINVPDNIPADVAEYVLEAISKLPDKERRLVLLGLIDIESPDVLLALSKHVQTADEDETDPKPQSEIKKSEADFVDIVKRLRLGERDAYILRMHLQGQTQRSIATNIETASEASERVTHQMVDRRLKAICNMLANRGSGWGEFAGNLCEYLDRDNRKDLRVNRSVCSCGSIDFDSKIRANERGGFPRKWKCKMCGLVYTTSEYRNLVRPLTFFEQLDHTLFQQRLFDTSS